MGVGSCSRETGAWGRVSGLRGRGTRGHISHALSPPHRRAVRAGTRGGLRGGDRRAAGLARERRGQMTARDGGGPWRGGARAQRGAAPSSGGHGGAGAVPARDGAGGRRAGRAGSGAGRAGAGPGAGRRCSALWPLAERRLGRVGRHGPHQGVRQGGGLLQGTGGGAGAAGTGARALGLPVTVLRSPPEERLEERRVFRAFGQAGAAPVDEEEKQQKEQK